MVPLNDHYQQSELRYFIEISAASVLVTSRSFKETCGTLFLDLKVPCKVLFVEDRVSTKSRHPLEFKEELNPDRPVMFQFTSGTTGIPKKIARTHANILFELQSLTSSLHLTSQDRFLGAAPFSHVNGMMRSMIASLSAGATLYPVPRFERRLIAEIIERQNISIFIGVPMMFNALAKSNFQIRPEFASLRLCVSASAPMPKKLNLEFYETFGLYVRQLYGSTETGTISVNLEPDILGTLESVGKPIAGVQVDVFTEAGEVAPSGEIGEIAVKSPAMIQGYNGADEINRDVFRNGYFFTGDVGKKDESGNLYLIGRKKFFINKGGYKINPHDIEALLENHPKVAEVVVIGEPTSYGDEKVKAILVLKAPCTEKEIVEFCKGKIADLKIPSLIQFRESLPKSPTGKIRRKSL